MQLRARRSEFPSNSANPTMPRNCNLADVSPHTKALRRQNASKANNTTVSLHTSHLEAVVGRENEIDMLNSSILTWISDRRNGSLYISGAPGTGKTATVTQIVQQLTNQKRCRSLFLNCMHMSSPREVYSCIVEKLGKNSTRHSSSQDKFVAHVESLLTKISERLPLILVLDEIDQLASRYQDVLCR